MLDSWCPSTCPTRAGTRARLTFPVDALARAEYCLVAPRASQSSATSLHSCRFWLASALIEYTPYLLAEAGEGISGPLTCCCGRVSI